MAIGDFINLGFHEAIQPAREAPAAIPPQPSADPVPLNHTGFRMEGDSRPTFSKWFAPSFSLLGIGVLAAAMTRGHRAPIINLERLQRVLIDRLVQIRWMTRPKAGVSVRQILTGEASLVARLGTVRHGLLSTTEKLRYEVAWPAFEEGIEVSARYLPVRGGRWSLELTAMRGTISAQRASSSMPLTVEVTTVRIPISPTNGTLMDHRVQWTAVTEASDRLESIFIEGPGGGIRHYLRSDTSLDGQGLRTLFPEKTFAIANFVPKLLSDILPVLEGSPAKRLFTGTIPRGFRTAEDLKTALGSDSYLLQSFERRSEGGLYIFKVGEVPSLPWVPNGIPFQLHLVHAFQPDGTYASHGLVMTAVEGIRATTPAGATLPIKPIYAHGSQVLFRATRRISV